MYKPIFSFCVLLTAATAQYTLQDDYTPSRFASMFDFFTGDDPTNGYVNYVSLDQAQAGGLFSTTINTVRMAADSSNVGSGRGRNAVRVESQASYNHGLFILDLNHMPEGCGTWPAFWLLGPNWPTGGEVDIIEGVNSHAANSFAMHTTPGCSITNGGLSGSISTPNCDINAPNQGYNVGCSITTLDTQTYGTGFNSIGGGVYATEWTSEAITIWFFPRGQIPADIGAGTPQPSGWGVPHARFAGACDIDNYFHDQKIVFTNTFCGDWAGQVWKQDSICAPAGGTCQEYVQNNPSQFQNAYWDINSLRVYQNTGGNSSPGAPVTSDVPKPSGPPFQGPHGGNPHLIGTQSTLITVTLSDAANGIGAHQPQPGTGTSQSAPAAPPPAVSAPNVAPHPKPDDTAAAPAAPAASAVPPAAAQPSSNNNGGKPDRGSGSGVGGRAGGDYTLWNGRGWKGKNGGGKRWWRQDA